MHRSNVLILIDPRHPDRNTLHDIVAALREIGAIIVDVNPRDLVIEAVIASGDLPTVEAMGGVAYVRPVFTYLAAPESATQENEEAIEEA